MLLCGLAVASGSLAVDVKFWGESHSLGLSPYQRVLVEKALIASEEKYGPYTLKVEDEPFSPQRSKVEAERGNIINLIFTSEWEGSHVESKNISKYQYPFLNGALGFRGCIINRENLKKFEKIKTKKQAKQLKLVQRTGWLDSEIYNHEGLDVTSVNNIHNMLSMVERKRVDCFPLSVLEINAILKNYQNEFPNLTIAPEFYFFYPLRVYIAIPKSDPMLMQRMKYGIETLSAKGEIKKLFKKYYGDIQININNPGTRLFIYTNPYLSEELNDQYIKEFLAKHR